jgi:putative phosphonate metabolism protein
MRYAVYYMPNPASPLWLFGSSAIGYDANFKADVSFPSQRVYANPQVLEWTADPRRYGFHATFKAPFELAAGQSETELLAAASDFARTHSPVVIERLIVSEIGNFIALVEPTPCHVLNALAADCVRAFEPFRAPLSDADRARRQINSLDARKRDNLDRWGYHLVFDDFRFHMTLTGRLDDGPRGELLTALTALYAKIDPRPVAIDAIAIYRQPHRAARFEVVERFCLGS